MKKNTPGYNGYFLYSLILPLQVTAVAECLQQGHWQEHILFFTIAIWYWDRPGYMVGMVVNKSSWQEGSGKDH